MRKIIPYVAGLLIAILLVATIFAAEKKSLDNTQVKGKITVSATSTVPVEADTATFTITAEALKNTTEEARNTSSQMVEKAILLLRDEFGIADKDITTDYMTINPSYEWIENKRTLVGQKATQTLTINIRNDLDKVGKVYGRLSVLDGISIGSISYSKYDTTEDKVTARTNATAIALKKAEDYANGAGVKVGRVVSISEGSDSYYSVSDSYVSAKLMSANSYDEDSYSSTTYYAGDLSVSASVTVVFELENK